MSPEEKVIVREALDAMDFFMGLDPLNLTGRMSAAERRNEKRAKLEELLEDK